jgi:23S rRNA (guanine745-N1)-methyltransferase
VSSELDVVSTDWSSAAAWLRCPLCAGGLTAVDATLRCERGHAFDIAREGYAYLLAPGRAAPKLAGDSKPMLRARRVFLERGHYQPLFDAIAAAVTGERRSGADEAYVTPAGHGAQPGEWSPTQQAARQTAPPLAILDAGCGEGYYLGRLGAHLRAQPGAAPMLFGMDIAKEAVRLAARRYPRGRFVVADVNVRWPFADASIAVLLDIFAPRNPAEFVRVLVPGGLLLVALPAAGHLAELRAHVPLLQIEPDKHERVIERLAGGFTLSSKRSIKYALELPGADAALLLQMTPSARHVPPEAFATLAATERVLVTAGFALLAFTKSA